MDRPRLRSIALLRAARDHTRAALLALAGIAALAIATGRAPHEPTEENERRSAVRVHAKTEVELAAVRMIAIDEWSEHVDPEELAIDVVLDREGLAAVEDAHIEWELLVDDIDEVAAAERTRIASFDAQRPGDWFAEYHDFTAIQARLELLAAEHPELVQLSVIGGSVEGRPILALRIGGQQPDAVPMLVNGAQHAREWIAAMVPICIADRVTSDPKLRELLATTELWVVPVVNPDGYQYSWSSDRYWRKNRREGHGVDLNRNFGVAFGGAGSSGERRSQIYRGPYAFSEPETQALRDLVKRESIAVHIDFHAYGQLLLHPWSYTAAPAKERDRYAAIGDKLASAIYAQHGQRYTIKAGAQLYPAAGTMSDWVHGEGNAVSFTIELRPKGGSGFVLPPQQIRPTCDEALAAVLELRKAI
ncbi:MAG TPA: M14 metallopeptidase family protein [Nannocystaceae bacterium]|nr:M14 metallopeptidase family protein [Nannocystaceae bacterium]